MRTGFWKARVLLVVLLYNFAVWALVVWYRHMAGVERERTYQVASGMEHLRSLLRSTGGKGIAFDTLSKRPDVLAVREFSGDARAVLEPGQRAYTVVFSEFKEEEAATRLKHYFSELVMNDYFYVITDANGKVVDFFWDKP